MDFVTRGIIEVLPPKQRSVRSNCDVKGSGSPGDDVGGTKLPLSGSKRNNRSRDRTHECTGRQNSESVKSRAKEARAQATGHRKPSSPFWTIAADRLPFQMGRVGNFRA